MTKKKCPKCGAAEQKSDIGGIGLTNLGPSSGLCMNCLKKLAGCK